MKFSHKTNEKLIDLMREWPALYNCQLTEYKDHQLQKNIWKNSWGACQAVGGSF